MSLLTFPQDPLPIRAEMLISGAWTDVTSRIRRENEIIISNRGRADQQSRPGVCTCNFTLNNRDAFFSTRVPTSTNYGKLGNNTPFRVSITEDRSFAILDASTDAARVRTIDKAGVSTTGDLDLRIEFEPDNWTGNGPDGGFVLATKWRRTASANRSWALTVDPYGYPIMWVSTNGTAFNSYKSATALPIQYGAVALRATMDVDNGAGGRTVTFYTSDSISGTYTQLGSPITLAGTIASFDGTADIELGRLDDGNRFGLTGHYGFPGRIYAFELRHVIGGTVVANANIYAQARGTTSWSDGLGNTWLVESTAEVTPDDRRFYGEMASLPQQWDISGRDVFVPAQAADVTRRLQRGGSPVLSAWSRYWQGKVAAGYLSATTPVTGMWPLEDGANSASAANIVPRGAPATIVNCTFGSATDLPAVDGCLTLAAVGSKFYGQTRKTPYTAFSFANFAFKMPSIPAGSTTLMDFKGANGIGRCNISVTNVAYVVAIYDQDGALINSTSVLFGSSPPTQWQVMRLQFSQSGGTGSVDLGWYHPGDGLLYGMAPLTFAGTAGNIVGFNVQGTSGNAGTQYSQMSIGNYYLDNGTSEYVQIATAFLGETTVDRWKRICLENGITGVVIGNPSGEAMGYQPSRTTAMEILYQVADVEQGVIYPARSDASLILRTRISLFNQYGPSISYAAGDLGAQVPLPTDDDALTRNDVTATRTGGSSATATVDSGPRSTASPTASPPGVGRYPSSIVREVSTDDRLQAQADWDAFLGTWDEPRWPKIRVDLERSNFTNTATKLLKLKSISHLDIGDLLTLTGLNQVGVPPDDALLLLLGSYETLGNRKWWIEFNTVPYGPYIANNLTSISNSRYRVAAANCTVTSGFAASGAATFQVSTAAGSTLWGTTTTKPGNFPIDIVIAGEVITISAISGTSSPQTFTVSARGVNTGGVGKAHLAGESVQVRDIFYPVL